MLFRYRKESTQHFVDTRYIIIKKKTLIYFKITKDIFWVYSVWAEKIYNNA